MKKFIFNFHSNVLSNFQFQFSNIIFGSIKHKRNIYSY